MAEGTDDPSVLTGMYHVEWMIDGLVALGWPEDLASGNAGVIVLTFDDGTFDQVWETGASAGDSCTGTYAISGSRLTMVATDGGDGTAARTVAAPCWSTRRGS